MTATPNPPPPVSAMLPAADIAVRPARPEELPRAAPVYRLADSDKAHLTDGDSPEAEAVDAEVAADLAVALAHHPEDVWLAESGDEVVGFAAATVRGRHWHLVYLFVRPDWQGRGIGGRLLRAIHASGLGRGCDVFSTEPSADPRGIAAYLGLGMMPALPALILEAAGDFLPPPHRGDGLEVVAFGGDAAAAIATAGDIDAVVRGARRPEDLRRWLREGGRGLLLISRGDAIPVGYALLRPERADAIRIGPVAVVDTERIAAVLARALRAAAALLAPERCWRVTVPGENRTAVATLLAAGFRPRQLAPMLATGPIGRWDQYVFGDLDVL